MGFVFFVKFLYFTEGQRIFKPYDPLWQMFFGGSFCNMGVGLSKHFQFPRARCEGRERCRANLVQWVPRLIQEAMGFTWARETLKDKYFLMFIAFLAPWIPTPNPSCLGLESRTWTTRGALRGGGERSLTQPMDRWRKGGEDHCRRGSLQREHLSNLWSCSKTSIMSTPKKWLEVIRCELH